MNLSIIFVISLIWCECISKQRHGKVPYLSVQDGNLIFQAATDKYIEFRTTTSSGVSINGIDVLSTLGMAHNATTLLEGYQKALSLYVDQIDSLEQRLSAMSLRWDNSSEQSSTVLSLVRLRRWYNRLLTQVNRLEASLLKNDCSADPCNNGGICQDMFEKYVCHCLRGWQGANCLQDVNECLQFEGTDLGCQNGATCLNTEGSYRCLCQAGYFGMHCTKKKADCNTGGEELCDHGTCVQQNTQTRYTCICDQGWTTNGTNPACAVDVDECSTNHPSCSKDPSVHCINVPGSFYCGSCPTGYTGNGYYCSDVNECEINNGGCSFHPRVACINTKGSRICGPCPPSYEGDGVACVFRGVCQVNNGGCHYLAQCRDNPKISSTYVECVCPAGYVGLGTGPTGCTLPLRPVDPCASNPCVNGSCSVNNVTGEYICDCKKTFTGRNCDILNDPCDPNPCLNGGTCQNFIGTTFRCICTTYFTGILCKTEKEGCGELLSGSTGVLKYPPGNQKTYDDDVTCMWSITTVASKILNITFTKFDLEMSTDCRSDWLQIHDGPNAASLSLGKFCGTNLPLGGKILTAHNVVYFWFKSDAGNASTGFDLMWNATDPACGGVVNVTSHGSIQSSGSPGNRSSSPDCYWSLHAPFGKRLLFHFFSLNISNKANCNREYIEFSTLLNTRNDFTFAKICNGSLPAPFYSPSKDVALHFQSDNVNSFFQMTYSVVEGTPDCGGIYAAQEGFVHFSKQPYHSQKLICEYKIQPGYNTRTKITFLSFDLRGSDGCTLDYVEIRDGPSTDSPLVNRYCGDVLPPSYISVREITIISSATVNSNGWKIKYEKICGMIFSDNTGSFDSPPVLSYKSDCLYQIQQPLGYIIELSIKLSRNYSEEYTNCNTNYVEVRDGDHEDAPLIKKVCDVGNEVIISTYNHLWIRYYRTREFATLSFEATYSSTETGCGGILRDKLGNIDSSRLVRRSSTPKCSWVIIAPPRSVIQLHWITFKIEKSYKCSSCYMQVFDNSTELGTGRELGKYCGNSVPPPSSSSSNIMTVVLVVKEQWYRYNFLATYRSIPEHRVCGGNYLTPAGIIKSPNYPYTYPTYRDCKWTIMVPPGQQILLNITDFDVEYDNYCRYDRLIIRNGGTATSPLIGHYCGTTIPKLIPSHTNRLYLRFISDSSKMGRGFRITWSSTATGCGGTLTSATGSIISPNYPERYYTRTDCSWHIIVGAGSRVQVTFSEISLVPNIPCNRYNSPDYVELFDGPTTNSKSFGWYCFEYHNPIVSSSHEMLVQFRAINYYDGKGFQLLYSTVCNNTLRGFRGVIESPNFLGDYLPDLNCLWDIIVPTGNNITITFSDLIVENKENCPDHLEITYLSFDDYDEEMFVKKFKYCSTDGPEQLTINSNLARVHLVSGLMGLKFRLEWQLSGCGGHLTQNTGTIQSPNYPEAHPSRVECLWRIEVDLGYSIELKFKDIDVGSCLYTWIQVYNGPDNSSTLISNICQRANTSTVSSIGNNMFIKFHSDSSRQGKGFTADYSSIPTRCGGKFTAGTGYIFSPNYPNHFDISETCFWLIQQGESHQVQLNFVDVVLPADCDRYYIKVYDGPNVTYPLLKTVCNSSAQIYDTIKSTFNEMYIEFRTPYLYVLTKGFLAKYRQACGSRIITEGSGSIRATQQDINDSVTCSWTIISSDPTKHVTLTITQMQMLILQCRGQTPVKIYNGETVKSPLLSGFCGIKIPPSIVSDGSALTIHLEGPMNFYATYSILDSHCGGTFNSIKGFFATPGYPNEYPSDVECEWIINVPPGIQLAVTFHEFDIPESEKCNTDFLEIKSNNGSGPLHGQGIYCGKTKPSNLTHQGNLWMMFSSSKPDSGATVTAKGFYAEFDFNSYNELSGPHGTIASPLYPDIYYNLDSFSWTITVDPAKIVLLIFKEFYLDVWGTHCFFSKITVFDGADVRAPRVKRICGVNLPDPIKSSGNVMHIQFNPRRVRAGSRFFMEWHEITNDYQPPKIVSNDTGCGSLIDINAVNNFHTLTSPGYPYGYKHNLNCEWIFSGIPSNHLVVQILDMDIAELYPYMRGTCSSDYVAFYQKRLKDNDWTLVKTICEKEDGYLEFTNLLKVVFVTNGRVNATGFKAHIFQRCGASMEGPWGVIHFNKTVYYGSGCQWNVTVRAGRTITVTFEEMNIPRNNVQGCDSFLILRNGKEPDSPILGRYCGTDVPTPVNTTGNHLYIKYSGSWKIKGFKLRYHEISTECGGDITLSLGDNSTEITSPNYPNIPFPHTECPWIIRAPRTESVRIDFEERFDLTFTHECETDYVEIRDGGTKFSPLIGRYCDKAPSTQFSTGNMMFVKFFTDTDEPRNGFKAKISMMYCGGTIRGTEGEIRRPSRITKDHRRNCTWFIVGPVDHYLNIQFQKLELGWLNRVRNKITITEERAFGNVTNLGEYTGSHIPPSVATSSNYATVFYVGTSEDRFLLKFNASRSECGGQLNSESGDIISPGYPSVQHRSKYCRWNIKVPEGRRVTLEFSDFDLNVAQGITIYDGFMPYTVMVAYLSQGSSRRIFETSSNRLTVTFWSSGSLLHRGFRSQFTSNKPTICSSDFSSESGFLTQPNVRNNLYSCQWIHNSDSAFLNQTFALSISLNVNTTQNQNTLYCEYASWAIAVMNQDEENKLATLCAHSVKNYMVRSPFPVTQVFSKAEVQMNFTILYNTYECGGIVNEQQGYLSSPNYPTEPSQPVECAWLLRVDEEQTINVTVVGMNLGDDCDKSFLVVYNGEGPLHPKIGKYCKTDKPTFIISQSNSLWIEFKHGRGSTGTGFNLTYEAVSEGCGGVYHDKKRFIQSPNYGKAYPNNAECLWEIRSDPGYFIGIRFFGRFHIEETVNCSNDYLEVWDWRRDQWISIAKICGRNPPSNIRSTGDRLRVMFRSNNKTAATGFKARWDWVCGGTFQASATPRTIVSPGYPIGYARRLNCEYNITTEGNVLVINFDDFELEGDSPNCRFDNLTIRTRNFSTDFYRERTYCGSKKPPLMRMHGDTVITFKTHPYANKRGFQFTYHNGSCGGAVSEPAIITGPVIERTGPSKYMESRINCLWNITAPPKQVVFFRLLYLTLSDCFDKNIYIYNGTSAKTQNKITTFCGNTTENAVIHADSGNMLVVLNTATNGYIGFEAQVYFSHGPAEGCGGPINLAETKNITAPYLESLDCVWTITAPRDYQIKIYVAELNLPGACVENSTTCSSVEIRDGGGPLSELIQTLDSSWNLNSEYLNFSTSLNIGYIRLVVADLRNHTFKAILTPVPSICGPSILNTTEKIKTLISPNYPDRYPPGLKCTWFIVSDFPTDTIELHFVNFNLTSSSDGKCGLDRIEITEDGNKRVLMEGLGPQTEYKGVTETVHLDSRYLTAQHTFCGIENSPFDYYSTSWSLMLTFRSALLSERGRGFKLEYAFAGCNRNYTSLQGRLYRFYGTKRSNCTITIIVPENRTISLYFEKLQMLYNSNCEGFEVRDGTPNGTLLLRHCGYTAPSPVFSYTSKLYIRVYNTTTVYDVGYTSTDAGRGCGGELYNSKGRVTSPFYPSEFKNDTTCNYVIRVPAGLYSALKFDTFDIQGSCDKTYVQVKTYSNGQSTVRKLCKGDNPGVIRSNSRIDIQYKSSLDNDGAGWTAFYRGFEDENSEVY